MRANLQEFPKTTPNTDFLARLNRTSLQQQLLILILNLSTLGKVDPIAQKDTCMYSIGQSGGGRTLGMNKEKG